MAFEQEHLGMTLGDLAASSETPKRDSLPQRAIPQVGLGSYKSKIVMLQRGQSTSHGHVTLKSVESKHHLTYRLMKAHGVGTTASAWLEYALSTLVLFTAVVT